jgi:hypothetical protein
MTAIECVTTNCTRLHTEIFRAESLDAVRRKSEEFFKLMPNVGGDYAYDSDCKEKIFEG